MAVAWNGCKNKVHTLCHQAFDWGKVKLTTICKEQKRAEAEEAKMMKKGIHESQSQLSFEFFETKLLTLHDWLASEKDGFQWVSKTIFNALILFDFFLSVGICHFLSAADITSCLYCWQFHSVPMCTCFRCEWELSDFACSSSSWLATWLLALFA